MAKKTGKAIWTEMLYRIYWLFIILVAAWVIIAGGLVISDYWRKSVTGLSQKVDPNSIPMNKMDPISGKPIMPGITSTYRGCIVGHCCGPSKVEWQQLSPEEKTATLRGFLASSPSPL